MSLQPKKQSQDKAEKRKNNWTRGNFKKAQRMAESERLELKKLLESKRGLREAAVRKPTANSKQILVRENIAKLVANRGALIDESIVDRLVRHKNQK
jgi:hypothetical protein